MTSLLAYGDVSEVIARVNEKTTTLMTEAQHAWSTEPIDQFDLEAPTVLVYPGQQFSSQTQDSPTCRQQTSISVVLLIVVPIDNIAPVVQDVHNAVVGWQVAPEYDKFTYIMRNYPYGSPLEIKAGYMWWQMAIESSYLHRVV